MEHLAKVVSGDIFSQGPNVSTRDRNYLLKATRDGWAIIEWLIAYMISFERMSKAWPGRSLLGRQ